MMSAECLLGRLARALDYALIPKDLSPEVNNAEGVTRKKAVAKYSREEWKTWSTKNA